MSAAATNPTDAAEAVVDALCRYRILPRDEREMHDTVARLLNAAGLLAGSEVPVVCDGNPVGRIDLVACVDGARVGVELKVGGSVSEILEQVDRYARSGEFCAIVLVTIRNTHLLPMELSGVPVRVLHIGRW